MAVYSKKRKDGTTAWYYDFMHDRVRYRGIGGATKTQALRALEKRRSEVLSGEFGLVTKVGNPKIEQFAEVYLKRRQHLRSHKRDDLSVRTLLKFFKGEFQVSRGLFACLYKDFKIIGDHAIGRKYPVAETGKLKANPVQQ